MIAALLLAAISESGSGTTTPVSRYDRITINHLHSATHAGGAEQFTQLICWQWYESRGRYHVAAWLIVQKKTRPYWDYHAKEWRLPLWRGGAYHDIRSASYAESWTTKDPELMDRAYLPVQNREGWLR